jgi:hypothetical protein
MRQIEKRLQKLKEAIRPDDNMFTFVELCRSMWQQDKKRYLEMANGKYHILRRGIAQFELEDLEAQRARDRSR